MGTDSTLHGTVAQSPNLAAMFMGALTSTMMEPEDVANAVAFATSDEAKYMTGTELVVDLGLLGR
jgi:NAD(P)-dependent dehydrogenase (short-subunit alcohol dehydrogenase family)